MSEQNRVWLGRAVAVRIDPEINPRKPIGIALSEEAAEELRRYLAKNSLGFILADPAVGELVNALDYVLKGDERSARLHAGMEASKGMEPSGG
jgi:hypothetical protein